MRAYGFGFQGDDPSAAPPGVLKKMDGLILGAIDDASPILTTEPEDQSEGLCFGDSGGPVFLPTCLESRSNILRDAIGERGATGLAQIGVLSFGDVQSCAGSIEEYVNLADAEYGEWVEEAAASMGGKLTSELVRA